MVADTLTLLRIPMAVAFVVAPSSDWRLAILAAAAATDLLDGPIARRFGSSRFGAVLDPVADKLFMAAAFGVVLFSRKLAIYEIVGVLLRDLVATVAFIVTAITRRPAAIPARIGGKAVTVAQVLTLAAFVLDPDSPFLHRLAWATAAIALYAVYDYSRAARTQKRLLGS
jgi:CDP-diacylglycerol--glycerol-3-phosphate 3-phosphatidyltransferase/cardiolipin synthase